MVRKSTKTETVTEGEPIPEELAEIQRLEEQIKARKKEYKNRAHVEEARKTLAELESKYDDAKRIFFAVNGARRILENAKGD